MMTNNDLLCIVKLFLYDKRGQEGGKITKNVLCVLTVNKLKLTRMPEGLSKYLMH